jgi:hypothetical protein
MLLPKSPSRLNGRAGASGIKSWARADDALAAFVPAGLLLAIRNEWDLITWIAPRHDPSELE